MYKEILVLFQNKWYYCLPVLDIPVSERDGNRESKGSYIPFLYQQNKGSKPVLSALFLCTDQIFLPWMLTERVLLKLAGD